MNSLLRTTAVLPQLTRSFGTTPAQSALKTLLHGSEKAKQEGELAKQQHSRVVGRGVSLSSLIDHI